MNETTQTLSQVKSTKVAILVYPGVELFDFAGPMEVFRQVPDAQVYTVSAGVEAGQRVPTRHAGLKLRGDFTLETAPQPDVLVIPGGSTAAVDENAIVLKWILQAHRAATRIIPVGTGAIIAGNAGLTSDKISVDTSSGVGVALRAVQQLKGLAVARAIANQMEYTTWLPTESQFIDQEGVAV